MRIVNLNSLGGPGNVRFTTKGKAKISFLRILNGIVCVT
jgi:hypothetical protein